MVPLLDLYLYINDKINFSHYKRALDDFEKLWGMNLHILTDNLSQTNHLAPLLTYLQSSNFMSYSFLDGTETGIFNNLSNELLLNLEHKKVNAIAVTINKDLIKDSNYQNFFSIPRALKLETYLKISKSNLADLTKIINFMLSLKIKLCIVDIEKTPANNNKLSPEEYYSCISLLRKYNNEGKIRFSIIECPYPQDVKTANSQIFGGCCGGIRSCMIDQNGNILPCHYLPTFSQGNISQDNLFDIWQNSKLFNSLRNRNNTIKGSCQNCKFLLSCGGCRAESFYKYKSLFFDDPYCFVKPTERI